MKRSLCFLSLVMLFLVSCSNDSNAIDESLLIKKIVVESEDFLNTTNFTYEGTKLKTISIGSLKIEHTYSGNNIIKIKRNNGGFSDLETTFEYDNQDRVSSELNVNEDSAELVVYSYNNDTTISYQKYYGDKFSQPNIGNTGILYQDTNGEILKIEQFNQGLLESKSVWSYDAKNNPFKNIAGFNKLPGRNGKYFNNLTSDNFNSTNQLINSSTFEYNYNNSNFPITCTQSFYENESLVKQVKINYFY
jgi:hypothetical protein